ncbi:MAG: hypothetical protein ACE5IJ_08585, partial [Thermoplasmata archaeon]
LIYARFHLAVLTGLTDTLGQLGGMGKLVIEESLSNLANYHRFALTEDSVWELIGRVAWEELESPALLDEAKEMCERNEYLLRILEAYELFLNDLRWGELALARHRQLLPLQPVPTSKVYELWILRLLTDSMRALVGSMESPPRSSLDRIGLSLAYDGTRLTYNFAVSKWSKILSQFSLEARPDFILNPGKGMAAIDAKYKSVTHLNVGDLERLLAYLLDFSEPQDHEEMKAFFVVLEQDEWVRDFSREDMSPSARIFSVEANPAEPRRARESVGWVCKKVLRGAG